MKISIPSASLSLLLLLCAHWAKAQAHLIGYLKNWQSSSTPFLLLDEVDERYDYLIMAFATPSANNDYDIQFVPQGINSQDFADLVQTVQANGKKVLLSIGGATAPISLDNPNETNIFISTVSDLLALYGFDGLDIDLEGNSLAVSGGSIQSPVDAPILQLIDAIKALMQQYRIDQGKKMILSITPETAFVQGGQSTYNGVWGAYLPLIHALRDSIDLLQVQLYNSGSMYGIDGNIYEQGTADFVVSQTEAVIQGFFTDGGVFQGLSANQVAVGLPACPNAAGGGWLPPEELKSAMRYLLGQGPQPGNYNLVQSGGYPDLAGMMCWSVNWDAEESCGGYYTYADVFQEVFGSMTDTKESPAFAKCYTIYPNPASDQLHITPCKETTNQPLGHIQIFDLLGRLVLEKECEEDQADILLQNLPSGLYCLSIDNQRQKFVKE